MSHHAFWIFKKAEWNYKTNNISSKTEKRGTGHHSWKYLGMKFKKTEGHKIIEAEWS